MRYFSYDCDEGFQRHGTMDEAAEAARKHLAYWRDIASSEGEWPDEAAYVCYGEIDGQIMELHNEDSTVDYRLMEAVGVEVV